MRFFILIVFCTINLTASAQFWQSKSKERFPLLTTVKAYSLPAISTTINSPAIKNIQLKRVATYDMSVVEDAMLKLAKRNMRYRSYDQASYNFSDLASFYILQHRFSEAKWYLLQSNSISRKQDDTKHTLSNLLALAGIKVEIGEFSLAKLDLQEAHDIASAKGLLADVAEINKRMLFLQTNKASTIKVALRYAEAVELANSKAGIN